MTNRTTFAMIRLGVSHIPMGLTPGHLSRAIRRQAIRGATPQAATKVVHSRLAMATKAWHKSWQADLLEVYSLLQPYASMPEGPAAPLVRSAALRMLLAVIWSNTTGGTVGGSALPPDSASGETGCAGGCFDLRMSRTDFLVLSPMSTMSSTLRRPPFPCCESSRRAALVLPWNISLEKV